MTLTTFKQLAAAVAFAGVAGAASAALVTLPSQTGTIADNGTATYGLTLGAAASGSFSAKITGSANVGDVLSFGLYDAFNQLMPTSLPTVDVVSTAFKREVVTLYFGNLTAGNYTLKLVSGPTGGGAYAISGSYNTPTTPVPEPISMALSLAGVAVVLAVRRRRDR